MSKQIRQKLDAEREAHAKTAKQLVDMQAVLGCIEKRVERFSAAFPGSDTGLTEDFIVDLQRMLSGEQEEA